MGQITLETTDGICILTADRPPANAMDVGLLQELVAAIEELTAAPPAALVLTGRPGYFSAGMDLKLAPAYDPDEQRAAVAGINNMALGIYSLPFPVVGAINGHAIAGGLVLALCSDLRVGSTEGRYGLTEIKVGVPYPQAAIGVVRAELAPHAARVLALSNELMDAQECLRLGVFDEVCAADAVLPRAVEIARGLAAMPGATYARTKQELRGENIARLREAVRTDPLLDNWLA